MVHGGPGGGLWQFFPALPLAADRAIILYDQLDSGRSDAPGDPANWTVERYVSEIEAVRSALQIKDFHLLGHSWGGILANRYAAARPPGLKSLILQGTPLSDRRLETSVKALYAALPNGVGAVLIKHEHAGTMDSAEYGEAFRVFFKKHLGRTSVKSVGLPYMASLPEDRGDALAQAMVGGKISGFAGRLKGLDDEPLLARIAVPTLVLFGEYDIMTRAAEQAVVRKLKRGALFDIPDAGHMAQFDQPDAWRSAIAKFLSTHDKVPSQLRRAG
jgi:proline iminopeptidase/L-proline amide hydrolase